MSLPPQSRHHLLPGDSSLDAQQKSYVSVMHDGRTMISIRILGRNREDHTLPRRILSHSLHHTQRNHIHPHNQRGNNRSFHNQWSRLQNYIPHSRVPSRRSM
ncbi:hypothetical protein GCN5 related N acetyltransferase [Aspergillus fumigatus]|nr:hypothetical protein GCN5 related N acetyltransferase [Aspergillus fumigatus]